MKSIFQIKKSNIGFVGVFKFQGSKLSHQIDLFLKECNVQKRFFSGQMSIEEYIGMKKKVKK